MRINCKKTFLAGAVVASLAAMNAQAGLTHRYTFNSDAKDSVGTAHGTLMNGATQQIGVDLPDDLTGTKKGVGLMNLGSGAVDKKSSDTDGAYVVLPTTVLNNHVNLTVEFWTDLGNAGILLPAGTQARVFDFGDPLKSVGAGNNYLNFIPHGSDSTSHSEFNLNGNNVVFGKGPTLEGYHHVACVFDCTNGYAEIYIDGVRNSHDLTSLQVTNVAKVANWLGRSEWGGDFYLYGFIDEFRTYDRALSGVEIAADYDAGSDVLANISRLGPVSSIDIGSADASVTEKGQISIVPMATFTNAVGGLLNAPGFTLSSSAPSIATVNAGGVIKALKPGSATISAAYSGKTASFVLTVTADEVKPTVVSLTPMAYDRYLRVKFSKPVDVASAQTVGNYVINGGAQQVTKAVLDTDGVTVQLWTAQVPALVDNTIAVSNVKDTAATPNVIDTVTLSYFPAAGSAVPRRFYYQTANLNDDNTGYNVGVVRSGTPNALQSFNIATNPNFPTKGGKLRYMSNGIDDGGGWGGDYISVVDALLIPTETGAYTFFPASDDDCGIYVSTDNTAANLPTTFTSSQGGWVGNHNYDGNGSGDFVVTRNPVNLVAGQKYYFRAINHQGGGGDNFAIAWQTPSMTGAPANGSAGIGAAFLANPNYATAPMSISAQPADTTAPIGTDATFTIGISSIPSYTSIQWYSNNVAVAGANGSSFTVPLVKTSDNNLAIYAVASNYVDKVESAHVKLTVNSDNVPPQLVKAVAGFQVGASATNITVYYNERVSASTATNKNNYTIPGLTVTSVKYDTTTYTNVYLGLSTPMTEAAPYTLTVTGVKDLAGNTIDANANKATFHASQWTTGYAISHTWDGAGNPDDAITRAATLAPNQTWAATWLGTPTWGGDGYNNYVGLIEGSIIPPVTGDYTFYIASDDNGKFYMNTTPDDQDRANMEMLCQVSGWSGQRDWTGTQGGSAKQSRSVSLEAGKRYFYSARWNEGGGGDGLIMGWTLPGTTAIVDVTAIAAPMNADLSSVTITTNPVSQTTFEGVPVTFTAAGTGYSQIDNNVYYQWLKNGVAIPGATAASYTTPKPSPYLADNGAQFSCVISEPLLAKTTTVATLTVQKVATPFAVVSAGAYAGSSSVGVRFSHPVDSTTATDVSKYTVTGYSIQSAVVRTNSQLDSIHGDMVVLTLDSAVAENTPVKVTGMKDVYGNVASGTVAVGIADLVGTDLNAFGGDPVTAGMTEPSAANAYRIVGGGSDIWGSGDRCQFAYKTFSGDFDLRARVANIHQADNWSKVGLMVRQSLDTNAVMIYQVTTPNGGQNTWAGGMRLTMPGDDQDFPYAVGVSNRVANPPYPNVWVRITREGQVFASYHSTNGTAWVKDSTRDMSDANPAFGADAYVGVCATSHNNGAGVVTVADVYDVSLETYVAPKDVPALTAKLTANGVVVSWDSVAGAGCTLISSDDLQNWGDAGLTVSDNGTTASVTITPSSKKFFQLKR